MKNKISVWTALLLVLTAVLLTFTVTLTFAWSSGLTDIPSGDDTTPSETTDGDGEDVYYDDVYIDQEKLQSVIDRFMSESINGSATYDITDALLKAFIASTGDNYASYMTKEEYEEYTASYQGDFVGIGVVAQYDADEKMIRIVNVIPDSPAEEAGLLVGDRFLAVGGETLTFGANDDPMTKLGELIRGPEGSYVSVTVNRDGTEKSFSVERRHIVSQSARYELCNLGGKKVGYIALYSFDYPAVTQFKAAIDAAEADGVDYIVYDLRNNGGGLLSAALTILTYILPDDSLITTVRYADSSYAHKAGNYVSSSVPDPSSSVPYLTVTESGKIWYNQAYADHTVTIPSAVLVNGYTASAGELFTSVLRDYSLAKIVGETTFAKGCMQVTHSLPDGSALKVTTAYYDPPSGVNYDKMTEGPDGITPDVELIFTEEENKNNLYALPHDKDRQFVAAFNALTDGEPLPMPPAERVN